MTIRPDYSTSKGFNPFYTMSSNILNSIKSLKISKPRFKCIDETESKKLKLARNSRGKFLFMIYDNNTPTKYYIKCTKLEVKGHEGVSRKNSTATSNINEVFSLFYLLRAHDKYKDYNKLIEFLMGNKSNSGLLTGKGDIITYNDLAILLDKDETAKDDVMIGFNNAKVIKTDIDVSKIKSLYWTYREKPKGVNPKNPSDIVIKFIDGTMLGYSNKMIKGNKDLTPKINTNIIAFFKNYSGVDKIKELINTSWNDVKNNYTSDKFPILNSFNIEDEKFSETISQNKFKEIAKEFSDNGLNFYGKDFYYKFRNTLIKYIINLVKTTDISTYILEEMGNRTFGDQSEDIPYKLLIGSLKGSKIKEVSNNTDLINIFTDINSNVVKVNSIKYKEEQTFYINYTVKKDSGTNNFILPITLRTRAAGGWSGKSLYISSSGVTFVGA